MTTKETDMTKGRVEHLNPDGLVNNPAFTNVAVVSGAVRTIYVGGQSAVTADGEIVGKGDLAAQTTQILANIETALAAAEAGLEHVIKWNVFVVEGHPIEPAYEAFQKVWDKRRNPPLITVAIVNGLAHQDFLAEMEAIAVVPE